MKISLQPDVQKFVDEKVERGEFASAKEAVNALLLHLRSLEEMSPDAIEELRAEIDVGLAELDRGQFAEFTAEDIIAEGHAARAAKKAS